MKKSNEGFWFAHFSEPLLHTISFLNIREMSDVCSICRNFYDSYIGFFTKIDHSNDLTYRKNGLSDKEFILLTSPNKGVSEKVFENVLHSGLIRDFKRVVNTLSFDDQNFSLLEMACFCGFTRSALYLIIGGFYKKKMLNFSLEYSAHSGKTEIIQEILKRSVNTQHVNRCLSRCIDKKFYDCAILLLNDHRCCFSFNHSSHIRKVFRHDLETQKRLIDLKKKRSSTKGRGKEKVTNQIRTELLNQLNHQKKVYEEMLQYTNEGKKVNVRKIKKKIGDSSSSSARSGGKKKKKKKGGGGGLFESLSGMESLGDEVDPLFNLMEREIERDKHPLTEKQQEELFRQRLEKKYQILPVKNKE